MRAFCCCILYRTRYTYPINNGNTLMKTFVYIQQNPNNEPNKSRIAVYRIKNNLPEHIETIIRGYRSPEQAVMEYLTANKHIPKPITDHFHKDYYMAYVAEDKGIARVKELT